MCTDSMKTGSRCIPLITTEHRKRIHPVGDLLIFNRGDGPMEASPYPGVLTGPENYDLTQPGPWVFKPEPEAAQHTSMNCLSEPCPNPTPRAPALFSLYTCYRYFTQRRQVCVCPSP